MDPTARKRVVWSVVGLGSLLILAAIAIPNLLRSRGAANEAARYGRLFQVSEKAVSSLVPTAQAVVFDRKVVRNAELELVVSNVNTAVERVRAVATTVAGCVEKSSFEEDANQQRMAAIVVRVPAARLDEVMGELKKSALRVRRENVEDHDTTSEYVDMQARLRNMHAEEEQYLSILKRASSIKDTLEVTARLQDVRGRSEQLQAQFNLLQAQVDMSTIKVALWPEAPVRLTAINWRPLANARVAAHELLAGLGEWSDGVVAFIIKLPLILVWIATVLLPVIAVWRIGRKLWRVVGPTAGRELGEPTNPQPEG